MSSIDNIEYETFKICQVKKEKSMIKYELKNGLNLEGVCLNKDCKDFNKQEIEPIGFGTFKFNVGTFQKMNRMCDKCMENTRVPIKFILLKCMWTWEGTKKDLTRCFGWKKVQDSVKFLQKEGSIVSMEFRVYPT